MTTVVNGKAERKSLAQQIDRLDLILDGLADGLNEAVADAVQRAVAVAVEAALRELLASAELQRRLRPEPAARPGLLRRAASALWHGLVSAGKGCWGCAAVLARRCRAKATAAVAALREGRAVIVGRVRRGLSAFARGVGPAGLVALSVARRFRGALLIALAVGTLVGLGCYLGGPAVSSVVSGLGGFVSALAASVLGRLRRMMAADQPREWRFPRIV
jgi:hypothetical protein